MKLLRLKARYRRWRAARKLKKSGYTSWAMYRRHCDLDIEWYTHRITDFYKGYPFVYCFEDGSHYAYEMLADYGPGGLIFGHDRIIGWCESNTRSKCRIDGQRVSKRNGDWHFDEMGGGDFIFAAFKDERDYIMFLLRWA
jgi:hypothetical protein